MGTSRQQKVQAGKLEREVDIHDVATFIHGALFVLHCVGIYYNMRKKKYGNAALHGAIAAYDLVAGIRHYKSKNE